MMAGVFDHCAQGPYTQIPALANALWKNLNYFNWANIA
ncbi:Hypothetical protein LOCK908_0016 [Lacticaseibacillus rhamnosus LOCK908]|nr:hypothetical protein LRHK_16 [Lacticaseibacillus rhamnosus ATCC 8530]AGP72703.1 Hypothetical protein LOCK908_0016 [Lacticaseibacillus rhamnosus LOCK908]